MMLKVNSLAKVIRKELIHGSSVLELTQVVDFVELGGALEEAHAGDTTSIERCLAEWMASISAPFFTGDITLDEYTGAIGGLKDALDVWLSNNAIRAPRFASLRIIGANHDGDKLVTSISLLSKSSHERINFVKLLHLFLIL